MDSDGSTATTASSRASRDRVSLPVSRTQIADTPNLDVGQWRQQPVDRLIGIPGTATLIALGDSAEGAGVSNALSPTPGCARSSVPSASGVQEVRLRRHWIDPSIRPDAYLASACRPDRPKRIRVAVPTVRSVPINRMPPSRPGTLAARWPSAWSRAP